MKIIFILRWTYYCSRNWFHQILINSRKSFDQMRLLHLGRIIQGKCVVRVIELISKGGGRVMHILNYYCGSRNNLPLTVEFTAGNYVTTKWIGLGARILTLGNTQVIDRLASPLRAHDPKSAWFDPSDFTLLHFNWKKKKLNHLPDQ